MAEEELKAKIEIWKKTIDVQQHFNDLEMRIRNFAVTILGALFGATGLALSRDVTIGLGSASFPLGLVLLAAAFITWGAFYFMDRFWYHKLLYGAVKHGLRVEAAIKPMIPEIGLTESIGNESPMRIGRVKIRSPVKIDLFYGIGAAAILLSMAALLLTAELTGTSEPGRTARALHQVGESTVVPPK